jgi:Asp-tRNA(Asn)/Glu-tRNA(Gln) amidotransferase B subunit
MTTPSPNQEPRILITREDIKGALEVMKVSPTATNLAITRLLLKDYIRVDIKKIAPEIASLLLNEVMPRVKAEMGDSEPEDEYEPRKSSFSVEYMDEYHYGLTETLSNLGLLIAEGYMQTRHARKVLDAVMSPSHVCWDLIDVVLDLKILDEVEGDELTTLIKQILAEQPQAVADIKKGKLKAIGSLIGTVMKKIKADPVKVKELFLEEIGKM